MSNRPEDREPTPEEMQEQIVAEELGVEEETIALPPDIRVGITLFELESGEFGFLPVTANTTLMDAMGLALRISEGIRTDLIAQKVVQLQTQHAQKIAQQAVQQRKQRPNIVIPGRKR